MPDSQKNSLRRIAAPEASQIRLASGLSALAAALWIPQAAIVAWLFGALLAGGVGLSAVLWAAAGVLGLAALRALIAARAEARLVEISQDIVDRQYQAILTRQQRVSPYDPAARSSAEIAALLIDKLPMLVPYLTRYAPAMARVRLLPLLILVLAFSMSWAVGLVLLIAGPLIPVFMALVGMAAQEASERQMGEISSLNDMLLERLGALTDIRLLGASAHMRADFETRADGLRRRTMEVLRIAFLSSTVLELFAALGVAMVAVFVGFALLGELGFGAYATPLTPFEGMFLLLLAPDYFQPLRDMAAAWHDRASARAVGAEIEALHTDAPLEMLLGAGDAGQIEGAGLIWSDLYASGLHLPVGQIAPEEAVALTGASGAGKSTLLAALGGLVPVEEGWIEIGGARLSPATIAAARAQMAWIPQAPFFFAGSLRDNLTLGRPPRRDLEAALELAHAEALVARLPEGLETQLGESGAGVSGGEARRLLIARAACSGARLLLADEPTADLDDATAAQVISGLLALRDQGAAVLAASHDPRLIAAFDREIAL